MVYVLKKVIIINKKRSNVTVKKLICLAVLLSLLLTGCVGNKTDSSTNQDQTEGDKGVVTINGSTTVQPVAQSIADEFNKIYPAISVEIQGTGSSAGIKAIHDGTTDIGTSSRQLNAEEKGWGLKEHIIAYDGIAVVVNKSNPVKNLSIEDTKKIFEGTIKNWREVGGENRPIVVISRESGSGTRSAFEDLLKLKKKIDDKTVSGLFEEALISEGNGAIKAGVASKKNAIGYVSLGYVDDTLNLVSIENVTPTVETIKSGVYKISRPLLMITKGEESSFVKKYLKFVLSDEGQKIVAENYITVD